MLWVRSEGFKTGVGVRIYGGSAWESNPFGNARVRPRNGFEVLLIQVCQHSPLFVIGSGAPKMGVQV